MPIRDYQCASCSNTWEEIRKDQSDPLCCPKCQSEIIQRIISAPKAFQFKGNGFYETDFKNKGKL